MLVRHEVKIVWHTGSESAAVSYSRYEDDERVDCHVIDQPVSNELPGRAMAFASFARPSLFDSGRILRPLAQHRGDAPHGSHTGYADEHARAAAHYRRLADQAREDAGLSPFPED